MLYSSIRAVAVAALLSVGSAHAADLKPLHKAPLPILNWSGLYIGAQFGGGLQLTEQTFTSPTLRDDNNYMGSGIMAGGQFGYNYQSGPLVWGVEADLAWANFDGKDNCVAGSPVSLLNCRAKADFLGTAAVRLGAVVDRALIFVKGGAAVAHVKHEARFFAAPFAGAAADNTRWGWMFGTGLEYALFSNWSAKVEYNYLDFGADTVELATLPLLVAGLSPAVETTQRMHLVKFGVNYRFGQGPVVARY